MIRGRQKLLCKLLIACFAGNVKMNSIVKGKCSIIYTTINFNSSQLTDIFGRDIILSDKGNIKPYHNRHTGVDQTTLELFYLGG